MNSLFEKYKSLHIKGELICLEQREDITPYYCYPVNAKPIGFEGCIMYCFIDGYQDMVFAANPESYNVDNVHVYPLAANFKDFMCLILVCGSANPVEQIIWMDKKMFEQQLQEEKKIQTKQKKEILDLIAHELNLVPMKEPFEYVKNIQANFDDGKIKYSNEYYYAMGIDR